MFASPAGDGANVEVIIFGYRVHPNAIAEKRAGRYGTRRIDGQNCDVPVAAQSVLGQPGNQTALTRSRLSRDSESRVLPWPGARELSESRRRSLSVASTAPGRVPGAIECRRVSSHFRPTSPPARHGSPIAEAKCRAKLATTSSRRISAV